MVETGVYLHYKGGLYLVSHVARHSETGEELVVYQDLDNNCYARPASMFSGEVTLEDGEKTPRFRLVRRVIHYGMTAAQIVEEGDRMDRMSAGMARDDWWSKCLKYLGFEVHHPGPSQFPRT